MATKLHVFREASTEDRKLPGVVYVHGGRMVINSTYNRVHVR